MPNIAVTTYCNLHCPYCFAQDMFAEKNIKNISIEQFSKILEWIAPWVQKTRQRTGIIGGEPLLHPQICSIIEIITAFCYQYNSASILFTNGIFLNENIIKYIPENMKILINYNHPSILSLEQQKMLNNNLELLKELEWINNENKIIFGLNLCSEINDYSFFKHLCKNFDLSKIRMAVSFPGTNINLNNYYLEMKPKFLDFIDFCITNNIKISMDCRIPINFFTDDEKNKIFKVCYQENYERKCLNPQHEIMPDFSMTTCFAHYSNIDCSKFSSFLDYQEQVYGKK